MAITKSETQITWAAANNLSVAASGNGTSDAFSFDTASLLAMITLKADNNGTPAATTRRTVIQALFTMFEPNFDIQSIYIA